MSSAQDVRQRGKDGSKKRADDSATTVMNGKASETLDNLKHASKQAVTSEWDYKLALAVITVLAFVTRFWGISHPDQVVFDEVHFGKVCHEDTMCHGGRWRKKFKYSC